MNAYLQLFCKYPAEAYRSGKTLCTFAVGGDVRLVLYPRNAEELISAVRDCYRLSVRYVVLGRGSNVVFSDEGFDGVVILTGGLDSVSFSDKDVTAEAGILLSTFARRAAEENCGGFAPISGIPGTVGGAVYMNAGAYGTSVSDLCLSSTAYDAETDRVLTFTGEEQRFSYRRSVFAERSSLVLLRSTFRKIASNEETEKTAMREYARKRREKQPLDKPSAGSVFRRKDGIFPARVIEDAGLKGLRVGDAEISRKHAGFIVNRGNATAADIRELIARIRTLTGQDFETEIIFL